MSALDGRLAGKLLNFCCWKIESDRRNELNCFNGSFLACHWRTWKIWICFWSNHTRTVTCSLQVRRSDSKGLTCELAVRVRPRIRGMRKGQADASDSLKNKSKNICNNIMMTKFCAMICDQHDWINTIESTRLNPNTVDSTDRSRGLFHSMNFILIQYYWIIQNRRVRRSLSVVHTLNFRGCQKNDQNGLLVLCNALILRSKNTVFGKDNVCSIREANVVAFSETV